MFSKVLVATDVSEASGYVINWLHELRPKEDREVWLSKKKRECFIINRGR
jgi:hypothetical protein